MLPPELDLKFTIPVVSATSILPPLEALPVILPAPQTSIEAPEETLTSEVSTMIFSPASKRDPEEAVTSR
jgi:hypothetical protein